MYKINQQLKTLFTQLIEKDISLLITHITFWAKIQHLEEYTDLIFELKAKYRGEFATNPHISNKIIKELLKNKSLLVKRGLAENPNLSTADVLKLLKSKDATVYALICKFQKINDEIFDSIILNAHSASNYLVNKNLSSKYIDIIYKKYSGDKFCKILCASHLNTPGNILLELSNSKDLEISKKAINTIKSQWERQL